ncbi:MAG: hypothetical protein AAF725_16445 [Acidobacteriota bacterium]
MKKVALSCLSALLLAGAASTATAQTPRSAPDGSPGVQGTVHADGSRFGVGTITFDNNVPFERDGQVDGLIGNQFDPAGTHSISSVSFKVAGNYVTGGSTGSIVMTLWDVNAASVQLLQRQNITNAPGIPFGGTGLITNVTVSVPLTAAVMNHTGAFIGGLRNTAYAACGGSTALNSTCDGVALTEGATDPGQGFNAVRVPFTSGAFIPSLTTFGSAGTAIPNRNAIFRATGDNLPVELMSFEVQ